MLPGAAASCLRRCLGSGGQLILPLVGLASVSISVGGALAQNADTLIVENARRFTVIDQITDLVERDALLKIYRARTPRARADLAEAFLRKYPQSWLLPEVYEIAAKAYIDLGELDRALEDGRVSLQILPESPLLLVPIANAEVKAGRYADAEQSAKDALAYLDRFARPGTIPEKKWPEVQQELRASCYFVLGRIRISQGVDLPPGEERTKELQESISFLARARNLNPSDPEIEYLTGLDYIALGRLAEAAKWMSVVYQRESPFQDEALAKLRAIFVQSRRPDQTFEAFLGALGPPELPSPAAGPASTPGKAELAECVGSQKCAMCHQDIYQNWSQTGMARMLRPYAPENILGDFVAKNVFYFGDEAVEDGENYKFIEGKDREPFARMIVDHGRHYFEIKQSDGIWHRYPVNYTIGSKWQQGYVTRLPDGQLQVFPIEYNVRYRKWVNFWKIIDAPGTERDDPRLWEKFTPATNYLMNCAVCHTSQLRNIHGGGFQPNNNLQFREPGIDCEMCHGPGGKHVAWHMQGKSYEKSPLDPPVDFARISSLESVAICSQCHMQSAIRAPGPDGELNYSHGPETFFKQYKSRPYAEFYLNARYKDGRFRQTSFIVESFLRSSCFRKGGATCVSCHDPHHDDAGSNPASLRFRSEPNRMCTQCHGKFNIAANLQKHTRHPLNSEGSECASCHMPRIMNALMSRARTHRIDDIPNARMTELFGPQQSPNACLLCHGDKNVAWLAQELETKWKVHKTLVSTSGR